MCNSNTQKYSVQKKIDKIYNELDGNSLYNKKKQCSLIKKISFIKDQFTRNDIDYLYDIIKYYIEFDIYIYNSFIKLCIIKKLFYLIDEFLEELYRNGIEPNIVTYSSLIDCYCNNNLLEKGEYYYNILLKNNLLNFKTAWNTIDVHGYQKWHMYFYLEQNKFKIKNNFSIICGRGNNSEEDPVLKEVIIDFCNKYNLTYKICCKGGKITIK